MVDVSVKGSGMTIVWRLPDHVSAMDFISYAETNLGAEAHVLDAAKQTNAVAPLQNECGASVAQTAAPHDEVPPKGGRASGASAPLLPLTRRSPARPSPSREGTGRKQSAAERIEYYRSEVRLLTAEKVKLTPAHDSHHAMVKSARDALTASFKSHPDPVVMPEDIRTYRQSQYAKLVEAGERWGRHFKQFKHVRGLITVMTAEADRLEKAK